MRFTGGDNQLDEPEINIISLIDVILVLLIFFMATATFENQARLKVTLPEASADSVESDRAGDALVIQISEQGRFFVGGRELVNDRFDVLKQAIAQAAGDDRARRVMIRADGKTPHQAVVSAMDAVGQLGFSNLSIATVRRPE